MNVDHVMSRLGLAQVGDVSDEALKTLCEKAEAFVRAGVTVTLDDCLGMNEATLAAFIKAKELVDDENRSLLVAAFRAQQGAEAEDQAADDAITSLVHSMERRAAS